MAGTGMITGVVALTLMRATSPSEPRVCAVEIPKTIRPGTACCAGPIVVVATGVDDTSWQGRCDTLATYLTAAVELNHAATREIAARANATAERLAATPHFSSARCTMMADGTERLLCEATPQKVVTRVELRGDVPSGLLRQDLRRRLFIGRGTLLRDGSLLDRQARRLQRYLEGEGFFGAQLRVQTLPVGGVAPNLGVVVQVTVLAGTWTAALGQVSVEGDAVVPVDRVAAVLRHRDYLGLVSRRFQPTQLEQDVRLLEQELKSEGWPAARVTGRYVLRAEQREADVVVRIDSGPKLALRFTGNASLSDERLTAVATFAEAGAVDEQEVARTAAAMRTAYQERGHHAAQVHCSADVAPAKQPVPTARRAGPEELDVSCQIDEGPQAYIAEVVLNGNASIDTETLIDEANMLMRPRTWLTAGVWVDAWVQRDRVAIANVYRRRGSPEADVTADFDWIAPGQLRAVFTVREGQRQVVGHLRVVGAPPELALSTLRKRLQLVAGAPFQPDQLSADRSALITALSRQGYVQAEVEQTTSDDSAGHHDIAYQITPGPRARFGGALVVGALRTDADFIVRQLRLPVGGAIDLVQLGEGRRRLRSLGVLNAVDIAPLPSTPAAGPTWLVVAVEESDAQTLDLVLSYSTDERFAVGTDLRDRNLFGRALDLQSSVRLGDATGILTPLLRLGRVDSADVALHIPFPFGKGVDVRAAANYRFEDLELYRERRAGAEVSVTRTLLARSSCRLCPQLTGLLGYELTASDFATQLDGDAAAAYVGVTRELVQASQEGERATIAKISAALVADRRDSSLDPRSGYVTDVRVELGHAILSARLGRHRPFWRLLAGAQAYLPLYTPRQVRGVSGAQISGPLVLAASVRYGAVRGPDATGLPSSETFAYGGDLSVRGIERRASLVGRPNATRMGLGNLELRWYVLPSVAAGALQVAALLDAGAVAYDDAKLLKDPTWSAGGAVRYVTPVGPLSVAYARPVVRARHIERQRTDVAPSGGRLHIAFGYAF